MVRNARQIEVDRTLTQDDFDRFARLSGDNNPIHVDAGFSARTRFGRTVAHGMLLNTIFAGLVHQLVPRARMQSQSLMFPAPTFADEPLCWSVSVSDEADGTVNASMRCTRVADNVVTCEATAVLRVGTA